MGSTSKRKGGGNTNNFVSIFGGIEAPDAREQDITWSNSIIIISG